MTLLADVASDTSFALTVLAPVVRASDARLFECPCSPGRAHLGLERARRPHHLPAVLSRREVVALLDHLEPPVRLIGEILYGSGLRLMECLALRIKDVDLDRRQLMIRRAKAKGQHDRAALLPVRVRDGDVLPGGASAS